MRGESASPVELSISPEKVFYIIVKAREFNAKVDPAGVDTGSNPAEMRSASLSKSIRKTQQRRNCRPPLIS